jgi:aminopeptidase N
MWWGDLVTCSSQEDMWLNEGFAKYSEYIFTEGLYGATAYKDAIRTNHRKMLQFAHIEDESFLALKCCTSCTDLRNYRL